MYENEFPKADDLVVVRVDRIADMGVYVTLLEYNGLEGMIQLSQLSRRRIRSVKSVVRVGRQEVALVVRVDQDKGYIDLSKRLVMPEEVPAIEDKWNKSKAVHTIMTHVAKKTGHSALELYESFGWEVYKKLGHCYDGFKLAMKEEEKFFEMFNVPEDCKEELMKNIRRRLTPQLVKIRADFEITCFAYAGIDAIKVALKKGLSFHTEETPVSVKLVAPPLYVLTTTTLDKKKGIDFLNSVLEGINQSITEQGGAFTIKTTPRTVSDKDERLLNSLMDQLEKQNQQVDGDETED